MFKTLMTAGALSGLATVAAAATLVEVTVTNLQPADGLFLTPVALAFHDASYDLFTPGSAASASLEALAEGGDTSGIQADVEATGGTAAVLTSPGGVAPILDPGESASIQVSVEGTETPLFSFASMVIPSNDLFIGTPEPVALFDGAGVFEAFDLTIFGQVWDAGTEVNNGQGAAFSTNGAPSDDEGGVVALAGDLSFLLGTETAPGGLIGTVSSDSQPLARITVSAVAPVPVPASLPLMLAGLAGFGALRRRG